MNLIERLTEISGKAVRSTVLILSGCATTFYPHDDYERYPAHRRDIAVYNLRGVLQENCLQSTVDENSFTCVTKNCLSWQRQTVAARPNMFGGGSTGGYETSVCVRETPELTISYTRGALGSIPIIQDGDCIKFGMRQECDITTKDSRQAAGFVKALRVYAGQL